MISKCCEIGGGIIGFTFASSSTIEGIGGGPWETKGSGGGCSLQIGSYSIGTGN